MVIELLIQSVIKLVVLFYKYDANINQKTYIKMIFRLFFGEMTENVGEITVVF